MSGRNSTIFFVEKSVESVKKRIIAQIFIFAEGRLSFSVKLN